MSVASRKRVCGASAAASAPTATGTGVAASTARITSSRLRGIRAHRRVDFPQQAELLRSHADLHPRAVHLQGATADGHGTGGRDQIALAVVRGILRLEHQVVELHADAAAERDGLDVALVGEGELPLGTRDAARTIPVLQVER